MRRFLKGLLTGTVLGAMANIVVKPSRKPNFKKAIHTIDDLKLGKRSGKILKGMSKAMDKVMK